MLYLDGSIHFICNFIKGCNRGYHSFNLTPFVGPVVLCPVLTFQLWTIREAIIVEIYKMNGNFHFKEEGVKSSVRGGGLGMEWKFPFILYFSNLMASPIMISTLYVM